MAKAACTGSNYGRETCLRRFKMTAPRRYQEINAPEIPIVTEDDGTSARIVCARRTLWGKNRGRWSGSRQRPGVYRDVSVPRAAGGPAGSDYAERPSIVFAGSGSSATRPARWLCDRGRGWADTVSAKGKRTTGRGAVR